MDGFCCWLIRLLLEWLIGTALEWAFERLKKRKAPKTRGKHFKGAK